MRLKYFLRGVGIGIIVTTIILTISHISNRKMSDNEIIDRALELGMSFSGTQPETTTDAASEAGSESEPTDTEKMDEETTQESASETQSDETDEVPGGEFSDESTTEEASDENTTGASGKENAVESTTEAKVEEATQESTTEASSEETTQEPAIEQTTAVQTTSAVSAESMSEEVVSCSIEVVPGMSSRTVCDMLKQNGIIADAADFDRYLVNTGYDDKIRAGEIWVNSGMSYEELAAVLYKK